MNYKKSFKEVVNETFLKNIFQGFWKLKESQNLRGCFFVYVQELLRKRYAHRHKRARNFSSPGSPSFFSTTKIAKLRFHALSLTNFIETHESP